MTDQAKRVLRAVVATEDRREAATVHGVSRLARVTFMEAYDLINELFSAGYLTHDLRITDAGRRAAK